jgi:GNAT superfamily N-acetyltransferase
MRGGDGGSTVGAPAVRVLAVEDAAVAVGLLARGFAEEPGNVALFPNEASRIRLFEGSGKAQLRRRLRRGTVHGVFVDGELVAVAVWDAPASGTGGVVDLVQGLGERLVLFADLRSDIAHAASVARDNLGDAVRLARWRQTAIAEASRGSAWHLAFLATDPAHRGKGLARALLERQLTRCDEDGLPAWLETTDPVNPPLYERFGFRTVGHLHRPAWWPGYWVMRREPRGDTQPAAEGEPHRQV